jgi:hypothetical protein
MVSDGHTPASSALCPFSSHPKGLACLCEGCEGGAFAWSIYSPLNESEDREREGLGLPDKIREPTYMWVSKKQRKYFSITQNIA